MSRLVLAADRSLVMLVPSHLNQLGLLPYLVVLFVHNRLNFLPFNLLLVLWSYHDRLLLLVAQKLSKILVVNFEQFT